MLRGDRYAMQSNGNQPRRDEIVAVHPSLFGDVQRQQVKTKELKVVGSEQVTVSAGTFDAFKVEITSSDGAKTTLWVAKTPRKAVKQVMALNGATVTAELQKH